MSLGGGEAGADQRERGVGRLARAGGGVEDQPRLGGVAGVEQAAGQPGPTSSAEVGRQRCEGGLRRGEALGVAEDRRRRRRAPARGRGGRGRAPSTASGPSGAAGPASTMRARSARSARSSTGAGRSRRAAPRPRRRSRSGCRAARGRARPVGLGLVELADELAAEDRQLRGKRQAVGPGADVEPVVGEAERRGPPPRPPGAGIAAVAVEDGGGFDLVLLVERPRGFRLAPPARARSGWRCGRPGGGCRRRGGRRGRRRGHRRAAAPVGDSTTRPWSAARSIWRSSSLLGAVDGARLARGAGLGRLGGSRSGGTGRGGVAVGDVEREVARADEGGADPAVAAEVDGDRGAGGVGAGADRRDPGLRDLVEDLVGVEDELLAGKCRLARPARGLERPFGGRLDRSARCG